MKYRLEREGKIYDVDVEVTPQGYVLSGPDRKPVLVRLETRADGSHRAITPWGNTEVASARRDGELWAKLGGRRLSARVERARPTHAGRNGSSAGEVRAPMAGKLLRLDAKVGDTFEAGQGLAVIEAMKMENELVAPLAGVVVEVGATAPTTIEKGALIVKLEPR